MPCGSSLVRSRQWGFYDFQNRQASQLFGISLVDVAVVECTSATAGLKAHAVRGALFSWRLFLPQ